MKVADRFIGSVRALTSEGNGVVDHPSGRVVFVPGAWVGEQVEAKITQVKSQFALSELVQVIEPHPHRREAPCRYHGHSGKHCGGCPWQFIAYEEQIQAKFQRVAQAMARIAPGLDVSPIIPSAEHLAYRNRAQLKSLGNQLGFVAAASHKLVDVEQCLLLTPKCSEQMDAVRAQVMAQPASNTHKQAWVTWDVNEESFRVNQRLPFAQANSGQNKQMQDWLTAQIKSFDAKQKVVELFAGSGNFTRVLSQAGFDTIVAVDVVEEAIANLGALNLPGVSTQVADLYKEGVLEAVIKRQKPNLLVLDPPRDGLKSLAQLQAKKSELNTIIYISCDLATFSRDAAQLQANGFRLSLVQPLDLFPQTPHVEILARLDRR